MKTVCSGKVERGKFIPDSIRSFKEAFWGHEGKAVTLTVERKKRKRSNPQNDFYFGVVVPLVGNAIGESDPQAVHDLLKSEFNYEIVAIGDKELRIPKSTTKLNTLEFEEYLEKIRQWSAEFLSVYVPTPNEMETV